MPPYLIDFIDLTNPGMAGGKRLAIVGQRVRRTFCNAQSRTAPRVVLCNRRLPVNFRYAPFATNFMRRCNQSRRAKNGSRPGASGARNRASTNPHSKVACVVVRHLTRGTMRPCTLLSPMAIIAPAACSNRCRRGGGRFAERGCGNRAYRHVRSLSAERFPCPTKNGEGTA